jgi:hypothetical protein
MPPDPSVRLELDRGPDLVQRLRLEILSLTAGRAAKIHVRDLEFTP